MSIRLYVGNLPKELERQELEAVFSEFDESVSTKLITDRKTGKCRGFAFVTVTSDEQADEIIEKFNGYMLKETPLKIEKALPRSKAKGEDSPQSTSAPPTPSKARKGSKTRKSTSSSSSPSSDSQAAQPDPRWADELAKLKELLGAQTTTS